MSKIYQTIYYPESKFGGFVDGDEVISFYTRVRSFLDETTVVLDVGCGRGEFKDDPIATRRDFHVLKGKCKKVIGIDLDPVAAENPNLDEFRLLGSGPWPVEDASIDVCVSDYVLEHFEDPDLFFSECQRVLKPGGYLFFRTSNLISYLGLAVKLIPRNLHNRILGRVQPERQEEDIFPTVYGCNTIRKIRRTLDRYDFEHSVYGYQAIPGYLGFSRPAYYLGILYMKFMPKSLKIHIIALARKR
jgi:SAM-dependent methyltransferase